MLIINCFLWWLGCVHCGCCKNSLKICTCVRPATSLQMWQVRQLYFTQVPKYKYQRLFAHLQWKFHRKAHLERSEQKSEENRPPKMAILRQCIPSEWFLGQYWPFFEQYKILGSLIRGQPQGRVNILWLTFYTLSPCVDRGRTRGNFQQCHELKRTQHFLVIS